MKYKKNLLIFGFLFGANACGAGFIDTDEHVYEADILYVKERGLVQGFSDGSYGPDQTINRVEFTKILLGSQFSTQDLALCPTDRVRFTDIEKTAWYIPYLCVGVTRGILTGYEDGTFRPAKPINLAEASKLIGILYGIRSDATAGEWYEPYVLGLESLNALPQTIRTVDSNLRRGEMASIMARIVRQDVSQPSQSLAGLRGSQKQISADINLTDTEPLSSSAEESETLGISSDESPDRVSEDVVGSFLPLETIEREIDEPEILLNTDNINPLDALLDEALGQLEGVSETEQTTFVKRGSFLSKANKVEPIELSLQFETTGKKIKEAAILYLGRDILAEEQVLLFESVIDEVLVGQRLDTVKIDYDVAGSGLVNEGVMALIEQIQVDN